MTVKQGYKLTEVGVIPEDWEVTTFSSICTKIQDGTHFSPKTGKGSCLYLTSKNIGFGFLKLDNIEYITQEAHQKIYQRCDVKKNDLLLTKDGANTGNAALNIIDDEFSLLSSVAFLRLDKKNISSFYLQQVLSRPFQKIIKDEMSGNAITRLTLSKINALKIYKPSLPEQTAIAKALSDADAYINSLELLIAKKQQIKQGTMQELLTGKKRLEGFGDGKGYKQTEIGETPKDWEIKKFTYVTSLITCGVAATPKYVNENIGFPFLSSTNVKNGQIVWSGFKYISKELHQQLYKNNPPKKGDILYSRVGTIGEAAIVEIDFEFSVYVSLTLIRPKEHLSSSFLKHLLNSNPYKKRASEQVYFGGGVGNLNVDVVRNYPILLPSLPEQTAIANILTNMDNDIQELQNKLSKAKHIKQGMMQELLTGKTRLI